MSLKTHFGIEEDPIFSMIPSIRNAESGFPTLPLFVLD
jgi:hypothetical protein